MRNILYFITLMYAGLTVSAQPLTAPTIIESPSSVTSSSFLININDTNISEAKIEVEISKEGSTQTIILNAGTSFNHVFSNLTVKTAYTVRARAIGCLTSMGCPTLSPWSTPYYVTTLVGYPPAPSLKLERNCARYVHISWSIPARPEDISNFILQRSFDGSNFETIGNFHPSQRELYDAGNLPGRAVYYRLYSQNVTAIVQSNILVFVVDAFVAPLPPINAHSSLTNKTDTQLNIVWENPEQDFACGSNIRRDYYALVKREGETEAKVYEIFYPTASNIIIKGLKPNERIEYTIFSVSDRGISSPYVVGVDYTYGPASKPTNVIGVAFTDAVNNSAIDVSWQHTPNDEDYFVVEVSQDGTNFKTLGKIKAGNNIFKHSPIDEGVGYIYRVKAGNFLYGDSDYTTTLPISHFYSTIPNKPYGLSGVSSATKVDLKWYDDSNKEENYVLERSVDNNTSFTELKKLDRNTTNYSDNTVVAGKTYFYRLKAVNPLGASDNSNIYEAKITAGSGLINTEISIYPNPTVDEITISNAFTKIDNSFNISILDQNNQEVYNKNYSNSIIKINLRSLKSGVYNLLIKNGDETISRKIVKY